jgi:hypothetical protein
MRRGSYLLRRKAGDEVEFITIMIWDSIDAIRAVAGPDYETAVIPEERRKCCLLLDDRRAIRESRICLESSKRKGLGALTMKLQVKKLEQGVSGWQHASVHPHCFGGMEFRFGDGEVGHIHTNGIVDIPFPRSVLLADGLAEGHRWVPNSGWITFQMRSEKDLSHALWLMRLSYLR